MTMKLTITNDDPQRTAHYEIEDIEVRTGRRNAVDSRDIAPGESRTVWIHAARQVVITENPYAIRRAKEDDDGR